MYKYVTGVTDLSHDIIKKYVNNKGIAVDGTLGNGHDTDFLYQLFNKVYSFEIQKEPYQNYLNKNIENVKVINDGHEKIKEYVKEEIDCAMYNLGYLPGGDKEITTKANSSLESIKLALDLLRSGGIITIAIYSGHNEGAKEKTCIIKYVESLPKNKYGVMLHQFINRNNEPPCLVVIEKK